MRPPTDWRRDPSYTILEVQSGADPAGTWRLEEGGRALQIGGEIASARRCPDTGLILEILDPCAKAPFGVIGIIGQRQVGFRVAALLAPGCMAEVGKERAFVSRRHLRTKVTLRHLEIMVVAGAYRPVRCILQL